MSFTGHNALRITGFSNLEAGQAFMDAVSGSDYAFSLKQILPLSETAGTETAGTEDQEYGLLFRFQTHNGFSIDSDSSSLLQRMTYAHAWHGYWWENPDVDFADLLRLGFPESDEDTDVPDEDIPF